MSYPGMTSVPCELFAVSVLWGDDWYVRPTRQSIQRYLVGAAIMAAWRTDAARRSGNVFVGRPPMRSLVNVGAGAVQLELRP